MDMATLRQQYLDPMVDVDWDHVDWKKALGGVVAIAASAWLSGEDENSGFLTGAPQAGARRGLLQFLVAGEMTNEGNF